MRRFLRRKKKLIIRLLLLLIFITFIILLIRYILPSAGINTFNFNNQNTNSSEVEVTIIDEPNVTVSLPEYITTVNEANSNTLKSNTITSNNTNINNSSDNNNSNEIITSTKGTNGKSYTSYVDNSDKYFITVLSSDNNLTIMLSNKAKDLLPQKTTTKIGVEYNVSGISETIVGVYDFTYSNYKYPILLLLSSSGKLYYIDLESSIKSGKFKAQGPIKKVSNIYKICKVIVTDGDKSYKSAVLTDVDGIGYEFTLDMIKK